MTRASWPSSSRSPAPAPPMHPPSPLPAGLASAPATARRRAQVAVAAANPLLAPHSTRRLPRCGLRALDAPAPRHVSGAARDGVCPYRRSGRRLCAPPSAAPVMGERAGAGAAVAGRDDPHGVHGDAALHPQPRRLPPPRVRQHTSPHSLSPPPRVCHQPKCPISFRVSLLRVSVPRPSQCWGDPRALGRASRQGTIRVARSGPRPARSPPGGLRRGRRTRLPKGRGGSLLCLRACLRGGAIIKGGGREPPMPAHGVGPCSPAPQPACTRPAHMQPGPRR